MTTARYLVGNVFDVIPTLATNSVDLVCTSPPFLALRSYLPADHPDKAKEIGSEPTPAEFLDTLLALTAEWDRVLAPHGSICVELGDTYSGSGGAGGDYSPGGLRAGQGKFEGSARRTRKVGSREHRPEREGTGADGGDRVAPATGGNGWPMAKSMCGIPHLYYLSLAYGRNLLTGEPSPAGMWRVRNVVAWCRPNPPVGALGDKFRPATSYVTIATKARDRYFDLDAVRHHNARDERPTRSGPTGYDDPSPQNTAGAPPLDWWEIPTSPYKGSHYAVFPPALIERPIKSMCPLEVCTECGEPRRRVVSSSRTFDQVRPGAGRSRMRTEGAGPMGANYNVERRSLGFTDCGHSSYRRGVVLDPFGGSGTTGAVATGQGRDAILVDLDDRNVELARERVGMFLEVELDPLSNPVPVVEGSPPREPVADPNARVEVDPQLEVEVDPQLEVEVDPQLEVEGCGDSSLEADADAGRLW